MDYLQEPFSIPPQYQPQMYYQAMPYPAYTVHPQQQLDDFYPRYGPNDYADFMGPGMMHDEFGPEMEEISTRPRLTKEQVEVLESQFQANHKPNSQVKRQLAIQTNLKFQRVGNWFQNRRAKAKQQKRQEEYEAQKATEKPDSRGAETVRTPRPQMASPTRSTTRSISLSPRKESRSGYQSSPSPTKASDKSKEASWVSLQRALGQAKAAQAEQMAQQNPAMAPPEFTQTATMQLPLRISPHRSSAQSSNMSAWPAGAAPYPSPITLQDNTFDFGFDDEKIDTDINAHATPIADPLADFIHESFVVTPEDLEEPLTTPRGMAQHQNDPTAALPSPGLTLPSCPGSRRQSAAVTDELSNHFGSFALAGSSPSMMAQRRPSEPIRHPPSGPLDIAARRKRPRPTPLTSASLRSRSYGAMTSVSPTFRPGATAPPVPHTIRHVKSAGHSLSSRYAGVRKASSAQRSPMCHASFAEAQAFSQLMAQQALNVQGLTDLPAPLLSPDIVSNAHMTDPEKNPFFAQNLDMSGQYALHGQNFSLNTASPPITPLPSDFMMARGPSQQSLCPPASAPPQYASFPDYTPPYSAGPMTNSSWSDALTSPDVTSFPPVTYVPSLGYSQHGDGLSSQFQQFVLPSDNTTELDFDAQMDQKKTEFYIQEFPNQKEEHAHVAQQLAQQKPKNYVFANTAPHDYTAD
ncbi:hypothetical protein PV05_06344 [Exophiala xenobiotica]|uniref:Homeobox domain-containing protein n=1 Tax=Exophiala xenobiotica TaxID=348802 RepID=A0A0D2CV07_9EURO|nr:uncharacterized protein PV05_06344 [Exophiala xenobiotica]KIW53937.1 hypothetical protein PV05_06344 [Exophiala xenobiotica]